MKQIVGNFDRWEKEELMEGVEEYLSVDTGIFFLLFIW